MEKTPSALLHAELLATCSALGWSENEKYHKNPDCLQSLKDLIRYLKNDDESHEIRRQLGAIGIVETDLLPLIKYYGQDKEIFDVTLRLLVNLTNPAIVLFKEELPEEKVSRNYYQECVDHLQKFKRAFADSRVWAVFCNKFKTLLEQDWEKKEDDDELVIERILILLRNVLHVPSNPEEEKRTDDDVSIHDQNIWAIHVSGMTDLVLYVASNEDAGNFAFHVIEIIFHMLREQEPEHLASSGQARPKSEKQKDIQVLSEVLARERSQKLAAVKQGRHPRFGGTFCVRNVKSVSENDLIVHRPVSDLNSLNFDHNKKIRKVPKNRCHVEDSHVTRRSTLNIRLVLRDFCVDFLENAYNTFMAEVKDHLTKQRAQDHDEVYYLWALRFFMEFRRLTNMDISRVSETVSKDIYRYIHTQIENYCELMIVEKKAVKRWAKRTHLALRAYKELILTLTSMVLSKDKEISESGRIISGNIYYVMEYRDILLHLLNIYDPQKFSKSYLKDLIEANHVFVKNLEQFCGQHKHVIVSKKKTKPRKKKSEKEKSNGSESQQSLSTEEQWDGLADSLSHVLQGKEDLPTDVTPFDATSEKSFEDQKTDAIIQIQDALQEKQLTEAVSLLRASRDLWPEGEVFGSANSKPEVDFLLLREIFFSDLPRPARSIRNAEATVQQEREDEEEDEGHEETSVQVSEPRVSEQEFSFAEFVQRYARPKVVQAYCFLLSLYKENSSQTNQCILKMMHRVAWDHKMYGLFFQASLFRTFQRILDDPAKNTSPVLKELCRFAIFIIRKFFETAEKNKKVFMEILFWKNSKEVYEIQEGYGASDKRNASKLAWSEEEEDELKALFERFGGCSENGKDAIDLILENYSNPDRTRRQIVLNLKRLGLIEDTKQYKRKSTSVSATRIWSEEETEQLTSLFEKFKSSTDIMTRIFEALQMRRSKSSISKKLLELGLVTDRKQLYKKASRRAQKSQETSDSFEKNSSGSESSDDSEDEPLVQLQSSATSHKAKINKHVSRSNRNKTGSSMSQTLDLSEFKSTFDDVVKHGFMPAVEWLKLSLESAIEDREADDDWESLPLVPFTEEQFTAMASDFFLKLVKTVGIVPPANEQETFWRIPDYLSPSQLKARVEALEKAEAGELDDVQNHSQIAPVSDLEEAVTLSKENSETLTKSVGQWKKRKFAGPSSDSEDDDLPLSAHMSTTLDNLADHNGTNSALVSSPNVNSPPTQTKRRRAARFVIEDEDEGENTTHDLSVNSPPTQTKRRRAARFVIEDEDEDEDTNRNFSGITPEQPPNNLSSDDESSAPQKKRPKVAVILSDDED